jgi:nitrogen fixation/metabolism regulation signal transduction histidine kinase
MAWLGACVSHEIRNPLGPIFLHVNPLEEELGEDSPNSVKGMMAA